MKFWLEAIGLILGIAMTVVLIMCIGAFGGSQMATRAVQQEAVDHGFGEWIVIKGAVEFKWKASQPSQEPRR